MDWSGLRVVDWNAVSALATLAAVIAAFWLGIRQNAKTQQFMVWNAGLETYRSYLELCIKYPDLALGDMEAIKANGHSDKYEWFFSILASAAEQILDSCAKRDRRAWEHTVDAQLDRHKDFIEAKEIRDADPWRFYSETFRQALRRVGAGSLEPRTRSDSTQGRRKLLKDSGKIPDDGRRDRRLIIEKGGYRPTVAGRTTPPTRPCGVSGLEGPQMTENPHPIPAGT